MFMHSYQIPCLNGGEGGIWGERGGRGVEGKEGDTKYKLFFNFPDKLNYQLFTFAFILLIWDIYGINSV